MTRMLRPISRQSRRKMGFCFSDFLSFLVVFIFIFLIIALYNMGFLVQTLFTSSSYNYKNPETFLRILWINSLLQQVVQHIALFSNNNNNYIMSKFFFGFIFVCGCLIWFLIYENTTGRSSAIGSIRTYFYTNETSVSIQELLMGPLAQNDPRLIQYIKDDGEKQRFLMPPSSLPYHLKNPNKNPSMGQSKVVLQILKNMRHGFFVECGGLDGETRSNTLDLEMNYNWKGLLIEADPTNFDLLVQKNRKAWMSNTCLATKPYPHQVFFKKAFNQGKISQDFEKQDEGQDRGVDEVQVQCFPLYTLLSVLNVKTVDYFSLDVEGLEYEVLKTIPFDKILIKVFSVEYIHDKGGFEEIQKFMQTQGYRVITKVNNRNSLANDLIFAHKTVDFEGTIPPVLTK